MDTITFLSAMFSVGCTLGLVLVVLAHVPSDVAACHHMPGRNTRKSQLFPGVASCS